MTNRSKFRGSVAVVGIGQTPYYKRGTAADAERKLCLKAIVAACKDAGIHPRDLDGFSSYGEDTNEPARLSYSLGTREIRWSTMAWGGGGAASAAAVVAGASAIISGQANKVVVYRASAERSHGRLADAVSVGYFGPKFMVHGIGAPANYLALAANRLIEHDGVPASCMRDLVRASYFHARNNPMAIGRNLELTDEIYQDSRWICEPLRLFDCSRENDAGAAVILVSAEAARDLTNKPVYLLAGAMGTDRAWGEMDDASRPLGSAGFKGVGKRLWEQSGYGPSDIDVAQVYCNVSAAGVAAMIDMGLCTRETAAEVISFDNLIVPTGRLPINTGGGDFAEGFMHGMGNTLEAVRQIRGDSPNQVTGASLSLLQGGPMAELASVALFGSEETL